MRSNDQAAYPMSWLDAGVQCGSLSFIKRVCSSARVMPDSGSIGGRYALNSMGEDDESLLGVIPPNS